MSILSAQCSPDSVGRRQLNVHSICGFHDFETSSISAFIGGVTLIFVHCGMHNGFPLLLLLTSAQLSQD